jgi:hypothetical protein
MRHLSSKVIPIYARGVVLRLLSSAAIEAAYAISFRRFFESFFRRQFRLGARIR